MIDRAWQITNATIVSGDPADEVRRTSGLRVQGRHIEAVMDAGEELDDLLTLNLHGLAVFPGLINSHDSLLATYHAYTPEDRPCLNWLAFDNQLKASALFKERMLLGSADLYLLGAYRNLVAGTTAVVDHIPHFVRRPLTEQTPIALLDDFGISHSICSYSLGWGDGARREYERAAENDLPYIVHIAEGFDAESAGSLAQLDAEGGLGEHTVLVHGLALSDQDLNRIAEVGASLVWCPVSNLKIYDRTMPVRKALERGINVCLGSDAAMYGSANLLADLAAAAQHLEQHGGFDGAQLSAMVSTNPARAFRWKDRGHLRQGGLADFFVLRGKDPVDPHRSLTHAELSEVYLVVRNGRPVYGDESLEKVFTEAGVIFDRLSIGGQSKIMEAGLKKLLESIRSVTGRSDDFHFFT